MEKGYVIGVDFGTDSVRALLVDAETGKEMSAHVSYFKRWRDGKYCQPNKHQFRQHPLDYIESLEACLMGCLQGQPQAVKDAVLAISIDATGSSPVAVDEKGMPLALHPEFAENPNAMFFLWKDHSAISEAMEINEKAKLFEKDYLSHVGGMYSAEWFWSKLLYVLRQDREVAEACFSWVEQSDWLPYFLTGTQDANRMKRNVCAAGHKGLWAKAFGGFPPLAFFEHIDPVLTRIYQSLPKDLYSADEIAGQLSKEWADKLGLSSSVKVGVGAIDAHVGAIGAEIQPGVLCKVMGTSTCDMLVISQEELDGKLVKGICGQVEGSIVPGLVGLEAGQSAFGDVFSWYRDLLLFSVNELDLDENIAETWKDQILQRLAEKAESRPVELHNPISLDWFNGRRTPYVDPHAKGAMVDLHLGSDAVSLFQSLVEATCFGSRAIVDDMEKQGVEIHSVTAIGGIAKKSSYVMQTLANVLQRPIQVHQSLETCALGACMLAATLAGIHQNLQEAMAKMGLGFEKTFLPDESLKTIYEDRYQRYQQIGNELYNRNRPI